MSVRTQGYSPFDACLDGSYGTVYGRRDASGCHALNRIWCVSFGPIGRIVVGRLDALVCRVCCMYVDCGLLL